MFILGILVCSGVVCGINVYESNSIEYIPTDESWKVSNVSEAINSLYSMKTELDNIKSLGNASATQILSGKTAVVGGKLITGTMSNMATTGYYHSGTKVGWASENVYLRFPTGAYLNKNKTGYVEAWTEASNLGITADKIAVGETIVGIAGTYSGSNIIPNLEASLKVINAVGWASNTSKLAAVVKINVGSSISYDMNGASTRVVNNSNSSHLGTNLNSTYGYIDGANYIVQTNSGSTNTIKGLKRGAAILEIDYGSTCGKHLIIVW